MSRYNHNHRIFSNATYDNDIDINFNYVLDKKQVILMCLRVDSVCEVDSDVRYLMGEETMTYVFALAEYEQIFVENSTIINNIRIKSFNYNQSTPIFIDSDAKKRLEDWALYWGVSAIYY